MSIHTSIRRTSWPYNTGVAISMSDDETVIGSTEGWIQIKCNGDSMYQGDLYSVAKGLSNIYALDESAKFEIFDIFKINFLIEPYELIWLNQDKPEFFDKLSLLYSKYLKLKVFS